MIKPACKPESHKPVCSCYCALCLLLFRNSKFRKEDAFIGFQKDTPASVIFQATNFLGSACAAAKEGVNVKKGKWADIFKWSQLNPSDCTNVEDEQQKWEDAVSCSHNTCVIFKNA